MNFVEELRTHDAIKDEVSLIEMANQFVQDIHERTPIVAYITTRPESIVAGTLHWLRKHHFPEAPIIAMLDSVPAKEGSRWKAQILEQIPTIHSFVDDMPHPL